MVHLYVDMLLTPSPAKDFGLTLSAAFHGRLPGSAFFLSLPLGLLIQFAGKWPRGGEMRLW